MVISMHVFIQIEPEDSEDKQEWASILQHICDKADISYRITNDPEPK